MVPLNQLKCLLIYLDETIINKIMWWHSLFRSLSLSPKKSLLNLFVCNKFKQNFKAIPHIIKKNPLITKRNFFLSLSKLQSMGIKSKCFAFICRMSQHQSLVGSTLFLVLCQHYFHSLFYIIFQLPAKTSPLSRLKYTYIFLCFSFFNKTQLNCWIFIKIWTRG